MKKYIIIVLYFFNILAKLHEILDVSAIKKKLNVASHHRENSDFGVLPVMPLVLPEISRKQSNNSSLIKAESKNIKDIKFRKINW